MTLLDAISIFVVLANLSLGLFVFIKGPKKKANIYFFLLTIVVTGWVFTNWIASITTNYYYSFWISRACFSFASLVVLFFVFFVAHFPKTFIFNKYLKVLLIIITIFFSIISFTDWVTKDVNIKSPSLINDLVLGSLYYFYAGYILVYLVIGFILFIFQLKRANNIERLKIKYVFWGFVISACLGVFTNLIWVMIYKGKSTELGSVIYFGPTTSILIILSMTYAILRYRLMDIKVVIRKGVVHILSFVILLFIYIYLLIYFQKYLTEQYQWPEQTATIVLVLLIVLTIEPLRRFLFKTIDQAFYVKRKEARLEAKKMKLILSSTMQFKDLISKISKELQSFFEVKNIQFLLNNTRTGRLETYWPDGARKMNFGFSHPMYEYIRNRSEILVTEEIPYLIEERSTSEIELLKRIERELKELKICLVWPIGERDELVGAFVLGEKERKEAFTTDNLDYLVNFQTQATMALANALLYKQAIERIAKL